MKIHTTQNLNSLGRMQSINNSSTIPNEEIRLNYSEQMRKSKLSNNMPEDTYERDNVSFKGKKEVIKIIQKAAGKEKKGDKILSSRFFDALLDTMDYETCVQAAVAAVVCIGLRPLAIMLTPSKKNKKDNAYASVHSMASGLVSMFTAIVLTAPFAKGLKYTRNHKLKDVDAKILKRMYPNLDLATIEKNGKRLDKKMWKDVFKNPFHTDFKNPRRVAKPKHISEVKEETLKSIGLDIDLSAMKNKPINEWVDRKGNKPKLELRDMFIAVKEDGFGENFFSLQHIDEKFLKDVYKDLDINSISKDGKRLHIDEWKNIDGSKFKLDLDNIHISSYKETADSVPLITGRKRFDIKDKTEKYCAYQTNDGAESTLRVPEKLGTEIIQEYLNADAANDIKSKLFAWMPDIVTRPFMASATIAIIPWIMKNVFHMEKSKKAEEVKPELKPAIQPQEITAKEDLSPRKEVA